MKDNVKRMRRQVTDWKKIFSENIYNKRLLSKIYKEHLKLKIDKTNHENFSKMGKNLNIHLAKEDIQMTSKHMKRYFTLRSIRELKIKTTIRHSYTPTRKPTSITITTPNADQDVEQALSFTVGNAK